MKGGTMNTSTNVIRTLRALMPTRALTLNEAYVLAEQQASKLLQLLDIARVPVDVARIAKLPKIEVRVQPRHRMPTLAGFSQWSEGRWLIVVNKDNVEGRRRFTLAHEFKHVLDHTTGDVNYAKLGGGDQQKHDKQIEQICDYFAACFLMPRTVVTKAWTSGIQDLKTLALNFNVSPAAMKVRLEYLGFLDDDRPIEHYFRSEVPTLPVSTEPCALAA
jgi:Zn-dependent peptidase ImmA (M78 family)